VDVDEDTVRAAGGVVWRPGRDGVEVLLVHRPKYDDWSLPKGKLEPGETDEDAARREVAEETGLEVRLGPELGSVSYIDRKGRPKRVRYWSMQPEIGQPEIGQPEIGQPEIGQPEIGQPEIGQAMSGDLTPQDEVDAVRWVALADAPAVLTYDTDRRILAEFAKVAD
jgi:8-oxo-dGTP diphosphatase